MMGWMAPLRRLGAKVPVGENQSADKEHRSDHPLHRQLRRCLQLHGFAVEQREHRSEGIVPHLPRRSRLRPVAIGNPPEPVLGVERSLGLQPADAAATTVARTIEGPLRTPSSWHDDTIGRSQPRFTVAEEE